MAWYMTHIVKMTNAQTFWSKSMKGRDHGARSSRRWEDSLILKLISKESVRMWIGFIWLRICFSDRLL
jgi:hypothetical protein